MSLDGLAIEPEDLARVNNKGHETGRWSGWPSTATAVTSAWLAQGLAQEGTELTSPWGFHGILCNFRGTRLLSLTTLCIIRPSVPSYLAQPQRRFYVSHLETSPPGHLWWSLWYHDLRRTRRTRLESRSGHFWAPRTQRSERKAEMVTWKPGGQVPF